MSETFTLVIAALILFGVIGFFVRICIRLRKGGKSITTVVIGATDEFLNKERNKAAETIVDENAGKRFTAQKTGDIPSVDN